MEELFIMSVKRDIETSSVDELYYWAISLGLNVQKSESALKRAIFQHYGVKDTSESPKKEGTIDVSQAEYSSYYTIEEVDENIAEFEGRVKVVIVDDNNDTDSKNDKKHSIIADKINFNRTKNSFTAIGDVEYITESPGVPPENIKGESMTFNLDNWRGSILKCISEQEKTVAEETQTFYYVTGEIKKSSSEVMGMDDVFIQTVEGSPYFNVSSTDMWMLNSSDYLIFSPFVKIGHVPLMWIPFYYHTENSLYFNPLYGYDSRRGVIFNNTVYLVGKKTKDEEDTQFSFLAYNMKETTNYDMNNMTLVPNDDATEYSSDHFKLMFDYYSKLGLYFGGNGDLNFFDGKLGLSLDSGIGFTRALDSEGSPVLLQENSENFDWDSSYILDTEVPYRYLLDLSLESDWVNMDFKTYSDIYFKSDFYDRGEDFLWINYFTDKLDEGIEGLGSQEDEEEGSDITPRDSSMLISNYSWGIDIVKGVDLSPEILKPFLKKFKIDFNKINLSYQTRAVEEESSDEDDSNTDSSDPEEEDSDEPVVDRIDDHYFYPTMVEIPLSLQLKGSFYDTSYKIGVKSETKESDKDDKEEEDKKVIDPLFIIQNPYVDTEDEEDEEILDEDIFTLEPNKQKENVQISASSQGAYLISDLSYDLSSTPKLTMEFDDSEWNAQKDVEYSYEEDELIFNDSPNGKITFNFKTRDNLFSVNDILNGTLWYKQFLVDADQENYDQYTSEQKINVTNTTTTKLTPTVFLGSDSHVLTFTHSLNLKVYDWLYNTENEEHEDIYFEWDEEKVTKHDILSSYTFNFLIGNTTLSHTRTLDPIDETDDLNLNLNLDFFKVTTNAAWGVLYDEKLPENDEEEDDAWKYDPVTLKLTYKPLDKIQLISDNSYNVEEEEFDKINGSISFYGFFLGLNSKYGVGEEWDIEDNKWIVPSEEEDSLFLNSMDLSYKLSIPKTYFWKNRITLDLESNLNYDKYFAKVTDSILTYDLKFNFNIFEFLDLNFSMASENNSMFLYFEEDREKLGITDDLYNTSLWDDLIKSFNLFSDEDRRESKFNLKTIGVSAVYKTPDWNFIFKYDASQKVEDNSYIWYPIYSFFVEWKPLKMVKTFVENEDDKWTASTKGQE